ncbi:MAG: serine/threonine protein kinase, partial [Phycisphaerales bacterium]|nr:serine/threonine protein kinase [Phycisphaerales bacterium]
MDPRDPGSAAPSHSDETVDSRGVQGETLDAGSSMFTGETDVRAAADEPEQVGVQIGRYRLLQKIGEGGFGSVFMAEQREPVVRQVALKIIKLGMDTRQVIARFAQEQQALARMDHPNVAKVFDAGSTEIGRPYFVMELCRGEPITSYCEKNRMSIGQRLSLFVQVCNAIQHAHQKGLIHRDIKPSNVLVSEQDGRPHAKVIDFGIAKATDARLGALTIVTLHEQLVGTPQYMSPEQAEGSLDIDTRTDVYSLGVLLYELMTGTTPFDRRSLKSASLVEIQRMIREVDPPRPSDRVSATQSRQQGAAGGAPALVRELRGELDWIVMRAIEKDRGRRYASASEFAADLQRYLDGRPVMAAPPSAAYRFRKFVKRNRALAVAGAAGALALLAGTGIATVGFISAIRSRDAEAAAKRDAISHKAVADNAREAAVSALRAVEQARGNEKRQAEIAQENADEAAAINTFLLDMLGSANLRELGREAKLMQALDRAGSSVGQAFAGRPKLEAAVRRILAKSYTSLGMTLEAEPHALRALQVLSETSGEDTVEFGQCLTTLASIRMQRGDFAEAIGTYERALGVFSRTAGSSSNEMISSESDYANALMRADRNEEAETILRKVVAARRGSARFASTIAHDLKAPVRAIRGISVFLRNDIGSGALESALANV